MKKNGNFHEKDHFWTRDLKIRTKREARFCQSIKFCQPVKTRFIPENNITIGSANLENLRPVSMILMTPKIGKNQSADL